MTSTKAAQSTEGDDLDDLFNYDAGIDDVFDILYDDGRGTANPSSGNSKPAENEQPGSGLGIDEEVKIARMRRPIAKLDATRLLSSAGIPKLRKISKDRLRFKGKGHEFSDVARLLNMYQLWLDDLYPRAKFLDGLAIIEKLGHSKRIQMMRKEWINEGKPKPPVDPHDEDFEGGEGSQEPGDASGERDQGPQQASREDSDDEGYPWEKPGTHSHEGGHDLSENEPDGLFVEDHTRQQQDGGILSSSSSAMPLGRDSRRPDDNQDPPEDELNALLAEHEAPGQEDRSLFGTGSVLASSRDAKPSKGENFFEDEMEVLAEMDDMGDLW